MYEILFDVPPNQNPGAAPGGGVLMLIESYYNFTNQLCTWKSSWYKVRNYRKVSLRQFILGYLQNKILIEIIIIK